MTPPLLVNTLKVSALQQVGCFRKLTSRSATHGVHWVLRDPSRRRAGLGLVRGSLMVDRIALKEDASVVAHLCPYFSRKPALTETRLRPFARRRESTARPLLVFMRSRKPWTLERLRLFG